MDGNDKALMVGIIGALLLTWQWTINHSLRQENDRIQAQLQQVQVQLQSFREGVLSR